MSSTTPRPSRISLAVYGKLVYRKPERLGPVRTPGGALRACRKALSFSQREFAAHIGVSVRTLSRWEFDDHQPPMAERQRVMTYLANAPAPLVRMLAYGWVLPMAPEPVQLPPGIAIIDAVEASLFASAEDADVSPRRLRKAMIRMLREMERLGIATKDAREKLEAKSGPSS